MQGTISRGKGCRFSLELNRALPTTVQWRGNEDDCATVAERNRIQGSKRSEGNVEMSKRRKSGRCTATKWLAKGSNKREIPAYTA